MDSEPSPPVVTSCRRGLGLVRATALAAGLATLVGCRPNAVTPIEAKQVPEVGVVRPQRGCLRWAVRQPGSIEAYE